MRPRPLACLAIAAVAAAPAAAHAQRVAVDAPAGSAAQAAIAIARQTGSSIVIADPAIARKTIRRIRGRMDANEAVRRLASATDARAVAVGPSAWRLVPRPQSGQRLYLRTPNFGLRFAWAIFESLATVLFSWIDYWRKGMPT